MTDESSDINSEKHVNSGSSDESDADPDPMTRLTGLLRRATLQGNETKRIIEDLTLEGLAKHWKTNGFKNIITMV
uniref:Uncharacterized protein n=1 Tax=Megaselia scalaris TaxID=36166 RepID=T1GJC8_MEGSC